MKNWYLIENRADGVLDISLHDEIGMWGVSASDFIADLRGQSGIKSINLSIHSPGGSVLDGLAIYNSLASHPAKVYGHVEGIAASAASFVLMAADVISMPEDAFIMIHNAHGGAMGDADDLRDMADVIEKLQNTILGIYEKRTGQNRDDIAEMMRVETWMSSAEALEMGFVDTVTDKVDVAAKHLFTEHFKTMPVSNDQSIDSIETLKDFEKFLRDSGMSKSVATKLTTRAKVVIRSESVEPESPLIAIAAALDKVSIPD